MTFEEFPYCCTAITMYAFEEDIVYNQDDDGDDIWDEINEEVTKDQYIHDILTYCVNNTRLALLVATTIKDQYLIEEVLTKLGFNGTEHFEKTQHEDTEVKLWWGHIPTLIEMNSALIERLRIVAKLKRISQYGYENDPYR